jgi:hypothetical protein
VTWLWVLLAAWFVGMVFLVALGMAAARGDRMQARAANERIRLKAQDLGRRRVGL